MMDIMIKKMLTIFAILLSCTAFNSIAANTAQANGPHVHQFRLGLPVKDAPEKCWAIGGKWRKYTKTSYMCLHTKYNVRVSATANNNKRIKMYVFSYYGAKGKLVWTKLLRRFKEQFPHIYDEINDVHQFANKNWNVFFSESRSGKDTYTIWMYEINYILRLISDEVDETDCLDNNCNEVIEKEVE